MYKIKWDKYNNSILLDNKISDKEAIVPPRPVFYEELNLLGFDKYWNYPESVSPLLWAIGRRYYYKGELIAEAKGGNIYDPPELVVSYNGQIKPINVQLLIDKNRDVLSTLENEAIDFVQYVHKKYRGKVDYFAVAFSGGKDSQVVLDIVSRVLAPDEYRVIFTDTGMELPFTDETVEATKKSYQALYPKLEFHTAKPPKDTLEFWKEFGPPSRIHRWCCSVCKTAPFANLIRSLHEDKKRNAQSNEENKKYGQPKILVFDGVRSDESNNRSFYKRIAKGVKHINQINAEVIQNWNTTEIFLYLFYRNSFDLLNKGYRYGLNRIGCSICPFATGWSENIIKEIGGDKIKGFFSVIRNHVKLLGIDDEHKIKKYIAQEQWKKRGGGEGVENKNRVDFIDNNNMLTANIANPNKDSLEWLKVVGKLFYKHINNQTQGEIKVDDNVFSFNVADDKQFNFYGLEKDIRTKNHIKTALYKTTYCVHCGVCESQCPNNAIQIVPVVKINSDLCIHCYNCLNFRNRGCLMASSIAMSEGTKKMTKKFDGFGKYLTFGLRKVWLDAFLDTLDFNIAIEKCGLGNKQKDSLKTWLKDAELFTTSPAETAVVLGRLLKKDENMVWAVIWVNLFYNSSVCKWFINDINWNSTYSSKDFITLIKDSDETVNERTMNSGISSLLNTFKDDKSNMTTPLGNKLKIGIVEKKGSIRYVNKIGTDDIHPMAIAYSLYKFAEHKKRYDFTVSEFYKEDCDGGPYKFFGISTTAFENILRGLQENRDQIVRVDLAADLDNIYLREDITSMDILKMVI